MLPLGIRLKTTENNTLVSLDFYDRRVIDQFSTNLSTFSPFKKIIVQNGTYFGLEFWGVV